MVDKYVNPWKTMLYIFNHGLVWRPGVIERVGVEGWMKLLGPARKQEQEQQQTTTKIIIIYSSLLREWPEIIGNGAGQEIYGADRIFDRRIMRGGLNVRPTKIRGVPNFWPNKKNRADRNRTGRTKFSIEKDMGRKDTNRHEKGFPFSFLYIFWISYLF